MTRGRFDRLAAGVVGMSLPLAMAAWLGCGENGGDAGGMAERAAAPAETAMPDARGALDAAADELGELADEELEQAREELGYDEPELDDVAAAAPDMPGEMPFGETGEEPAMTDTSDDVETGTARTYVVKPGDTLRKIAGEVYGDPDAWPRLHEANRARVPEPQRMAIGTELVIP